MLAIFVIQMKHNLCHKHIKYKLLFQSECNLTEENNHEIFGMEDCYSLNANMLMTQTDCLTWINDLDYDTSYF